MKVKCLSCGSGNISNADYKVANKYPLLKCDNCNLSFLQPDSRRHINEKDYWNDVNIKIYSAKKVILAVEKKYGKYLEEVLNENLSNNKLLDVGCGIGTFLSLAERSGFKAVGVEPSIVAVKRGRRDGREIHCGYLGGSNDLPNDFSIVTAWDVIEHIDDPNLFLKSVYKHMCADGILYLETPDQGCFSRRIILFASQFIQPVIDIKRNLYYVAHRNYFTTRSMKMILNNNGFQIKNIYKDYSILEKLLLKRKYQRNYNSCQMFLLKIVYSILVKMPFLSNKMIIKARKV